MFDFKFPLLFTETKRSAVEWSRFALTVFQNASAEYPDGANRSYTELIESLGDYDHQQLFLNNFGKTILSAEFTEAQVTDAMKWLASYLKGRLPKTQNMYYDGLIKQAGKISPLEEIGRAAENLTSKAEDLVKDASQGTVAALNIAKWVVPFALLAAGGYILFARTKELAGTARK
jgi:hypothetical protein